MPCNITFQCLQRRSQNAEQLRSSKGYCCIRQWSSAITSLIKMGTSLKGKNLLTEGANSFLKRSFSRYGKLFYHNRWAPLSVTIFITHVHILRNGSYVVCYWIEKQQHTNRQIRRSCSCTFRFSTLVSGSCSNISWDIIVMSVPLTLCTKSSVTCKNAVML